MKVVILLFGTCTIYSQIVQMASIEAPLSLITYEDLTQSDRQHLQQLNDRHKRSGGGDSGDLLSHLKDSIIRGIKNKVALVAKSSASASGHFSSSISHGGPPTYHHHHHDEPPPPETHEHKTFDFWSLKKSIFNTLLQAVKAIKGGVIAIKGQLIKGGGHLISAKGKLISAKGEAITNLGKHIVSNAILSPTSYHHSGDAHHEEIEYGPPPSGHYEEYHHGAPSGPGPEYHIPHGHYHHPPHYGDKEPPSHAGILILKKIPKNAGHKDVHGPPPPPPPPPSSSAHDDKIPDFKPLEQSGPSFGSIFSKFFAASSSLDPHEPSLFGAHPNPPSSPPHDHFNDHDKPIFQQTDQYLPPSPPTNDHLNNFNDHNHPPDHFNDHNHPPSDFHAQNDQEQPPFDFPNGDQFSSPPSDHLNSFNDQSQPPFQQNDQFSQPPSSDFPNSNDHLSPPTHQLANFNDFANNNPSNDQFSQNIDYLKPLPEFQQLPLENPPPSEDLKPPSTSYGTPFKPEDFNYNGLTQFQNLPFEQPRNKLHFNDDFNVAASKNLPQTIKNQQGYKVNEPSTTISPNSNNLVLIYSPNEQKFVYKQQNDYEPFPKTNNLNDLKSSIGDFMTKHPRDTKINQKLPSPIYNPNLLLKMPFKSKPIVPKVPKLRHPPLPPPPSPYNIVKSISYELGPNGPKRLT